jgi:predicted naringenin-chalcone synthase
MVHDVVLGIHIAGGVLGLALGPLALSRARRPLAAYRVAVLVVCASTLGLVAMDVSGLWPFALLALGTAALVIGGQRTRRRDVFIRLIGGSYISLVTALLVVSWGSVAAWLLPTLLGIPLVEWCAARTRPMPAPVQPV